MKALTDRTDEVRVPHDDRQNPPNLTDLIESRRQVLAKDDAWARCNDDQRDAALAKLECIQQRILKADFGAPGALMMALAVLLEGSEHPNFADDFKNQLFDILRMIM